MFKKSDNPADKTPKPEKKDSVSKVAPANDQTPPKTESTHAPAAEAKKT